MSHQIVQLADALETFSRLCRYNASEGHKQQRAHKVLHNMEQRWQQYGHHVGWVFEFSSCKHVIATHGQENQVICARILRDKQTQASFGGAAVHVSIVTGLPVGGNESRQITPG